MGFPLVWGVLLEINFYVHVCTCRLRYLNLDDNEFYMIPHLKLLGTSPLKPAKSTKQATNDNTTATLDNNVTETPAHVHLHSTLPASQDGNHNIGDCGGSSNGRSELAERTGSYDGGFVEERGVDGQGIKAEGGEEAVVEQKKEEACEKIEDAHTLDGEPLPFGKQNTEGEVEAESAGVSEHVAERERDGATGDHSSECHQKNPLHLEGWDTVTPPPLHSTNTLPTQTDQSAPITSTSPSLHSAIPFPPQTDQSAPTMTTPPFLHSPIYPSSQVDRSAPKFNTTEKQRVDHEGSLQSVHGVDEKSKELAPFPQLETLSLVNNMVRFDYIAL